MTTKNKESKNGSAANIKKERLEPNKKKTSEIEEEEIDLPGNPKVKEDSKKNLETQERR